MRIPNQTGGIERIAGATADRAAIFAAQTLSRTPRLPIRRISVDCRWRHFLCEAGCGFPYHSCLRSGVDERTCANRNRDQYLACSDSCDDAYAECRGTPRDPNYDAFADHFANLGPSM